MDPNRTIKPTFGNGDGAARLLHVAVIPDGNGRWAASRGLPRTAGHQAGVESVRRLVEAAPGFGIGIVSLYVFSADNWERPQAEVLGLLGLRRAGGRPDANGEAWPCCWRRSLWPKR